MKITNINKVTDTCYELTFQPTWFQRLFGYKSRKELFFVMKDRNYVNNEGFKPVLNDKGQVLPCTGVIVQRINNELFREQYLTQVHV